MQKKINFLLKLCLSRRITFAPPLGFKAFYDSELYDFGATFISSDDKPKLFIQVDYGEENFEPQQEMLDLCKEKKCVALGNVFKVKRGKGEAYALFFNHCEAPAKIYSECYPFERDENGYNRVNVSLWVWDENDANAAKKALNKPEIKEFFDSIRYC